MNPSPDLAAVIEIIGGDPALDFSRPGANGSR